ncbi:MAG TPA: glycosyltransferase family 2 protein [Polyangiaceae bacterium]|nr:glycosyltransferase family 2 protein [Polyangiaceae bacterium]
MPESRLPFVSVVMPCLNEEGYVEDCVRAVLAQDYPADRFEVLVADGMSADRTRALLARVAAGDARVRVIDNLDRTQSAGLNAAIRAAEGEIIVRADVHADYAPDFLRRCVEVLAETGADNVGGAARARAKTWFQRALRAALDSPLGVGGSKYRRADNEGYVDTVFPGAFRRRVFETAGLFDPRAVTNEDAEMNQRIHELGGRVYLSRKIVVHYFPRASFAALAKQYFKYGKGRARTLLKHRGLLTVRPALPFLMVTGGAALLATSRLHPLAPFAFGAYALGTAAEALRVGRKAGALAVPIVWAIFPTLHLSHGVGFGVGLVQYLLRPDWAEVERLAARPEGVEAAGPASGVRRRPGVVEPAAGGGRRARAA